MSSNKRTIEINREYLTRVEGHGNIVVNVREGRVETCELRVVEAPRLFEGMLRGRSVFEAPHITSRICGICACGHTLASIKAAEEALGIVPSVQTLRLRELLLLLEILDSHLLHIYFLAAPDFLNAAGFIPLIDTQPKAMRRALRLKKACNHACEVLAGRHVHPISAVIGGFTKLPGEKDIETLYRLLTGMRPDIEATAEFVAALEFPSFQRDTEYVALSNNGDDYPLLEGDVVSTDGARLGPHEYRRITNEFVVPYSTAKHARLSRESYA
ncbi:MAG: nickel-dependent hydrogenase large subunit, partial [Candidatus Methanoperedens sp.]|nr:nickel-dependent hydrogenase large subunit [Candidatus Methanoperedens sp.]